MQKLDLEFVPVLVRIQPSPKYGGVGVFAMRDIDCGTVLCDAKSGQVHISWAEFPSVDAVTRKYMLEFCAQDEEGIFESAGLELSACSGMWIISCEANAACDAEALCRYQGYQEGEIYNYSLLISKSRIFHEMRLRIKEMSKVNQIFVKKMHMQVVRKNQTKAFKNSAACMAFEYPTKGKDINGAVIELTGRYPDAGMVMNEQCSESYHCFGFGSYCI